MTGDCHVRICGGRGAQFSPATRPQITRLAFVARDMVLTHETRCFGGREL